MLGSVGSVSHHKPDLCYKFPTSNLTRITAAEKEVKSTCFWRLFVAGVDGNILSPGGLLEWPL